MKNTTSGQTKWLIRVWDGCGRREFYRTGTYDQVTAPMRHFPPGYIWGAELLGPNVKWRDPE